MAKGSGKGIGGLRSNEAYLACEAELAAHGIPFEIEYRGKHPKLVFTHSGQRIRKPIAGTPGRLGAKKAAADIRRILRAEEDSDMQNMAIVTDPVISFGIHLTDGVPHIRDVELGERLGLERPDRIRSNIIERHIDELRAHGHVVRVEDDIPMPNGGHKKGVVYYLNEEQALTVCQLSRAPKAPAIRSLLTRTFVAWRRGSLPPALTQEQLEQLADLVAARINDRLGDVAATGELVLERITRVAPEPDDFVTSYEVAVDIAEVPLNRLRSSLSGWLSCELLRYCAKHGYHAQQLQIHPGTKWRFSRKAATEWLDDGGRVKLWGRVKDWDAKHAARAGGRRPQFAVASGA